MSMLDVDPHDLPNTGERYQVSVSFDDRRSDMRFFEGLASSHRMNTTVVSGSYATGWATLQEIEALRLLLERRGASVCRTSEPRSAHQVARDLQRICGR
jgi:hypothetical protein